MRWHRSLFRRRRADDHLDAELRFHIEEQAEEYVAAGMPKREARRRARLEFGGVEQTKELCRQARPLRWLEDLARDFRLAVRNLARSPGYAIAILLTLGLGLGLNMAVFIFFSSVSLRTIAVHDPGTLVSVRFGGALEPEASSTYLTPEALLNGTTAFQDVLEESYLTTGLNGRPAYGAAVSGNYFSMLSPRMLMGRPVQPDDEAPVVVLGEDYWRVRLGADPEIVGSVVRLGGYPFEVVGVMRAEYRGFARSNIGFWVPLESWRELPGDPELASSSTFGGRLRDGVTVEQAQEIMAAYTGRVTGTEPGPSSTLRVSVQPIEQPIMPVLDEIVAVFLWVFGLTMAIPCTNAANLMLARALARQREVGVRLALGAGRARVVRQILTEGLVLSLAAALVGFAVARAAIWAGLRVWYSTVPASTAASVAVPMMHVGGMVMVYVFAAAVLTAALFAFLPALQSARLNLVGVMKGEVGAVRGSRLRNALLVGQVVLCTVFLVSAAALAHGTKRLVSADPGFDPAEVFLVECNPETTGVIAVALESAPWVEQMAFARGDGVVRHGFGGAETDAGAVTPIQRTDWVSPEYFPLVRRGMIRGRSFTRDEALQESDVAIVSQTAAAKFWLGEDGIGKRLLVSDLLRKETRTVTVVGVVRDVFETRLQDSDQDVVYLPATLGSPTFQGNVMLRGKSSPDQVRQQLRDVLRSTGALDRGVQIESIEDRVSAQLFVLEILSWIASVLGGVALLLTGTGIFAATWYIFGRRTKELGIRMVLGATALDAARFIFSYFLKLTVLGMVVGGIIAGVVVKWLLASVVNATGPAAGLPWSTYAAAGAVIVLAAVLASLAPALRAARVQPAETLRVD